MANWFSCSGKSSERSTYSQLIIFWTNFAGRFGLPGMGIAEVVGMVEVASVVGVAEIEVEVEAGILRDVDG